MAAMQPFSLEEYTPSLYLRPERQPLAHRERLLFTFVDHSSAKYRQHLIHRQDVDFISER